MQLAAQSRGIVYRDRLVLEKGVDAFSNAGKFLVEANTLQIHSGDGNGSAQVSIRQSGMVEVAALMGPARVTNSRTALLLANLQEGKTVDFTPESSRAAYGGRQLLLAAWESTEGKFLLTDEASLVRFEILGTGLTKEVGRRVTELAGTVTPVPDALSQVQSPDQRQGAVEEVLESRLGCGCGGSRISGRRGALAEPQRELAARLAQSAARSRRMQ